MARAKEQHAFPPPSILKTLSSSNMKSLKTKVTGSAKTTRSPNPFSFTSPLFQPPRSTRRSVKFSKLAPSERAFLSGWRQRPWEPERPLPQADTDASSSCSEDEDDETTLAELDFWTGNLNLKDELDADDPKDDMARHEALVLSLQAPFAALGAEMKKDMLDVVVPTTGMLKEVHGRVKELDDESRIAVLKFSSTTETIQVGAAEQAAKLKSYATESQIKVHQTFQAIKETYTARAAARTSLLTRLHSINAQLEKDLDALDGEYEEEAKKTLGKSDALSKSRTTKADMDKYLKMMMSAME